MYIIMHIPAQYKGIITTSLFTPEYKWQAYT